MPTQPLMHPHPELLHHESFVETASSATDHDYIKTYSEDNSPKGVTVEMTVVTVQKKTEKEETPIIQETCKNPRRILALLSALYFLVMVDRGFMASNGINGRADADQETGLQVDIEMSNFQNGLLASLVTLGLVFSSPITSFFSKRLTPLKIIAMGMVLWSAASAAFGAGQNFGWLAACRFIMGVGQYPIYSLGFIIIDDVAPEAHITKWFATFYFCRPLGVAVGFLSGPILSKHLTWRYPFYMQSLVILPFVLLCLLQKPFHIRGVAKNSGEEDNRTLWNKTKVLFSHEVFVLAVVGDSLYIGFISTMEYWAARGTDALFGHSCTDTYIGVLIVIGSTFGCFLGGTILDFVGSSISNALYISSAACCMVACILIPSILTAKNFYVLVVMLFFSFTALFLPQGPMGGATIWTVPLSLRPLGRDASLILQQLLGSVPTPALYGYVVDAWEKTHDSDHAHRVTTASFSAIVLFVSLLFLFTARISPGRPDYRVRQP